MSSDVDRKQVDDDHATQPSLRDSRSTPIEAKSPLRLHRRKYTIGLVKLAIGIGIVYWLIQSGRLNPAAYDAIFEEKRYWWLIGTFMAQAASVSLLLGRWWLLVRAQGFSLSIASVMVLSYRGMFASLLFPGIVGLDGVRILHFGRWYPQNMAAVIASMVIDRAIGLLGLLLLAVVFGSVFAVSQSTSGSVEFVFAALAMLVGLTLIVLFSCGFIAIPRIPWLFRSKLVTRWVDAFAVYRHHHGALGLALIISVIGHFLIGIAACCGLGALGLPISVVGVSTVTPLVIVSRFLPITPLGLGVSDGVAEELYTMVGLSGGAESQMLLRLIWILILLICGLSFFVDIASNRFGEFARLSTVPDDIVDR